ncbi:Enhanced ethylene response protein 5 [Linum grandiflorum]
MAYLSMGESHRRITDYLNRFSDAVSYQDGDSLGQLFSVSSNSPSLLSLADALNVFQDANRLIKQSDKFSQFGEVVAPFFRALQSYRTGNLVDAYQAFEKSANAFIQEFRNWESAWALEALYVIAYEIRVLAERADRDLASNGKSPEKLKGAGSFLMKVFGVLAGKGPKRVGALYVTCQLFKVYFKLGTVHLCRSVIRSIETARIFDFEEFPTRDKVTYMYYTGRLEVLNENFPAADQKLSYALTHCSLSKEANIRMILKYLIPVKLSIGIIPKKQLLEDYNLVEYTNVVEALKRGDLRLLRSALQEHEDQYVPQIRCLSCPREARTSSLSKITKEDLHYPKAKGPKQRSPTEVGGDCQSIKMARDCIGYRRGGMHNGNIDIQEPNERLLSPQVQGCGVEQAGPFP